MPAQPADRPLTKGLPGRTLEKLCREPMDVSNFLEAAIQIARALADLHTSGIIHRNIKPQNIFMDEESGAARIIDLSLASRLPREPPAVKSPRVIEGTLAYMSPEQTGRMNRWIDCRTDLYSLGVTYYEMLTGRLPFQVNDALEWVHCHIARSPPPPDHIVPAIPAPVSGIVMKLLAKAAEDRYESALGLRHDLAICLERLRADGAIKPFPLGERDVSDRMQIPQKLYGREAERARLLDAFERMVERGAPELLLVSGYSGIGKSSLVHELHKPVVRERGFFISGKFDQYKRNIPYSTIAQAFNQLVLEVATESEEKVSALRQELREALGVNGQVIVDLIPQIELIIGEQAPVPELLASEAQNRFNLAFRQFLGVFTRKEHPIVLFLDDLQWADTASLRLIEHVISYPDTRYLLIIGAYRDNEVTPSHPLMLTLDDLRRAGVTVGDVVLTPLSVENLGRLVGDMLHCTAERSAPLARLVHSKTAGNPFFSIQFLTLLHEEQLIDFDAQAAAFRWDLLRIEEKGFTDNVIDLLVRKLKRLPSATTEALKLAACVGNSADIRTLAVVYDRSEQETHDDLWEAVREGLLLRQGDAYRFLHDRVQQAAYSLIPEEQRKATHLKIGRLLFSHTTREALEEAVFDVVNQLNLGAALITDAREKIALAELNLVAGRKAKASAAHAAAAGYLSTGTDLLTEEGWEGQYSTMYALCFERAECEYLTGNFEEAERLLFTILRRARTAVDRTHAYRLKIDLHTTKGEVGRSIESGIQCLQMFGIELSAHPTKPELLERYKEVWERLEERTWGRGTSRI